MYQQDKRFIELCRLADECKSFLPTVGLYDFRVNPLQVQLNFIRFFSVRVFDLTKDQNSKLTEINGLAKILEPMFWKAKQDQLVNEAKKSKELTRRQVAYQTEQLEKNPDYGRDYNKLQSGQPSFL